MNLQELLGEELYTQVTAKLGDNKIDIVNNGAWIPLEKFNSINEDNKELKNQLSQRDKQLKTLGEAAKDNEALTTQIEALKEENKKTISTFEETLKEKEMNYALESSLKEAKVRNSIAVKALLNRGSIKLDDKGALVGLEEQLKALKETDPYLFSTENIKGREPNGAGGSGLGGKNPFSKEHFNLTEQGKIYKENPELAKRFMEEAN